MEFPQGHVLGLRFCFPSAYHPRGRGTEHPLRACRQVSVSAVPRDRLPRSFGRTMVPRTAKRNACAPGALQGQHGDRRLAVRVLRTAVLARGPGAHRVHRSDRSGPKRLQRTNAVLRLHTGELHRRAGRQPQIEADHVGRTAVHEPQARARRQGVHSAGALPTVPLRASRRRPGRDARAGGAAEGDLRTDKGLRHLQFSRALSPGGANFEIQLRHVAGLPERENHASRVSVAYRQGQHLNGTSRNVSSSVKRYNAPS